MFVSSQTNHKVTAYSSFIPVLTRFKCQDIRLTRSSTIYADKRVANKRLWASNNFRLRMYLKFGYFFYLVLHMVLILGEKEAINLAEI